MRVCWFNKPRDRSYDVWLDGNKLRHVCAADEEEGWVVTDDDILCGRVSIVDPRLLPIPAQRKLVVMVATPDAQLSQYTRSLIDLFRRNGDIAEVVMVGPGLQGYTPDAVWIDELADALHGVMRQAVRNTVGKMIADEVQRKSLPPNHNDRAWQTKRRKGR